MKKRLMIVAQGLVVLSLLLLSASACQGYGTPAAAPSAPKTTPAANQSTPEATATAGTVAISGFVFNPGTITVAVGAKVTWTNRDSVPHTVTSDTGVFGSSNLATGASFSFSFDSRGTFSYHCAIHPSMTAQVVVE